MLISISINLFVILILFQLSLELRYYVRLCSTRNLKCTGILSLNLNIMEHQHLTLTEFGVVLFYLIYLIFFCV